MKMTICYTTALSTNKWLFIILVYLLLIPVWNSSLGCLICRERQEPPRVKQRIHLKMSLETTHDLKRVKPFLDDIIQSKAFDEK